MGSGLASDICVEMERRYPFLGPTPPSVKQEAVCHTAEALPIKLEHATAAVQEDNDLQVFAQYMFDRLGASHAVLLLGSNVYPAVDWKGHQLDKSGRLLLCSVTPLPLSRSGGEFRAYEIYLFTKILFCIKPGKTSVYGTLTPPSLKGRVYLHNITHIEMLGMSPK